jgi:hypothetical protein
LVLFKLQENPDLATFFHGKKIRTYVATLTKIGLGYILAVFQQTHLVTLLGKETKKWNL